MSFKCQSTTLVETFTTPAKRTWDAVKRQAPKFTEIPTATYSKAEQSTNSVNSTSKLEYLKELGLVDLLLEWFIDMVVNHFKHVIEKELLLYVAVDFEFFNH